MCIISFKLELKMTPIEATNHLRDLEEDFEGVKIWAKGVTLTQGTCPWDVGLTLEVLVKEFEGVKVWSKGVTLEPGTCPEAIGRTLPMLVVDKNTLQVGNDPTTQYELIKQKITDYVQNNNTVLYQGEDEAGRAFFYEKQGYRFTGNRGIPTTKDQYPGHAPYRYVFAKEEAQPPAPPPNIDPQPLPAPEPMTPEAAIAHLRQWVKEQKEKRKEQGLSFGVTVFSDGPIWLTDGVHPWDIGLRLVVEKPEQFGAIKQKVEKYGATHLIELALKKDAEGHAYFYEERGYRFVGADGFPCSASRYPEQGDYHYVLDKAQIPVSNPIVPPPPAKPKEELFPNPPPKIALPAAFKRAQTCPLTRCFAQLWSRVSRALISFVRCLCCRGKRVSVPGRSGS